MTDRELLELAAMAVGLKEGIGGAFWTKSGGIFDPLTDDGDALRLAVELGLIIDCEFRAAMPHNLKGSSDDWKDGDEEHDPYAATRRAIVRAAAEIGKGMKD